MTCAPLRRVGRLHVRRRDEGGGGGESKVNVPLICLFAGKRAELACLRVNW